MKFVSSLAIATSLVAAGFVATPALAQKKAAADQAAPAQRKANPSKEALKALQELEKATLAKAPDFPQKLAAAQAVAKTAEDRYLIGRFQLQQATDAGNQTGQISALEAIIASGGASAAEVTEYQSLIARLASATKDLPRAEAAYAALSAANPNDAQALVNLAVVKRDLKKPDEALSLLQKAIALNTSAGQKAPESWYVSALTIAHNQKNDALALQLAQETQKQYPNATNFQNLINVSHSALAKDEEAYVDLMRLRRASGTMTDARDYLRLAEHLDYVRNWGEAKAVLEAAASAGKSGPQHAALLSRVNARVAEDRAALPTVEPKMRSTGTGTQLANLASVYAGYGDYAKAVELYRLALQKGGVDSNLVNTRLGIALVQAGQRAEAEAAFRAVTGTRAPLANLWLAWLAQRG